MSANCHPSDEQLLDFAKGRTSPAEALGLMSHILTPCGRCQSALATMSRTSDPSIRLRPELSIEEAALLRSRQEDHAREAVARLLSMEPRHQGLRLRNSARLRTMAAVELLIEEAYALRFSDLDRLEDVLDLAGEALRNVTISQLDSSEFLSDLAARLASHYANLKSIRHEIPAAREFFAEADRHLEQGTGDPIELANSLKLRIAAEMRAREFDRAFDFCDRASNLYRRCGDSHSEGEVLLLRAGIEIDRNRFEQALDLLSDALPLLDPEIDPATLLNVRHNRVLLLQELGRTDEALDALKEALPLYDEPGREIARLNMIALESRLARDLGQSARAERSLLECLNGFVARDLAPQAAEMSLELATLYLEQNRNQEARRIARQTLPILRATGMQDEAFAAVLVFREATLRDQLSLGLVNEALRVVRQANESA